MRKKRAIFLDKDGTLIPNIPYNTDLEKIKLFENACKGVRALFKADYDLFIVTNQSGIARGYFQEAAIYEVRGKIESLLHTLEVRLSGFYICPHHPNGKISEYSKECTCRKPSPGLLLKAAQEHDIDLSASWMIGDILNDVEAGNRAGCKSILINNGGETVWKNGEYRQPYFIADHIDQAAQLILNGN